MSLAGHSTASPRHALSRACAANMGKYSVLSLPLLVTVTIWPLVLCEAFYVVDFAM